MSANSKIEWCDATVNFWWGCAKVSPGCAHCYADALSHRWGKDIWGAGKPREDHRAGAMKLARQLNAQAEREGRRLRVFSASMSDWLDAEVPIEWLADLLATIHATPQLDWLLLTKRPENWRLRINQAADSLGIGTLEERWLERWDSGEPPENVWIGTSVEDQTRADERIPLLLQIPARVRFLSCEPLLGAVEIGLLGTIPKTISTAYELVGQHIHWVIGGGESGPQAQPMHPGWARSLRDQCVAAGVPFFFKQWGEWCPAEVATANAVHGSDISGSLTTPTIPTLWRVGKKAAGRLLDGREWNEFPQGIQLESRNAEVEISNLAFGLSPSLPR